MDNTTTPQLKTSRLSIPAAIGLGLLLLAVDFTTKAMAITHLPLDQLEPTAVPFFFWRLIYNTGSHYLLGPVGEWVPYRLMMGLAGAAVIGMIVLMAQEARRMPPSPMRTIYWLITAVLIGALGNALEVVALGRATDFFMLNPFPWPSNLCDQFVNAVVFVLVPLSFYLGWRQR